MIKRHSCAQRFSYCCQYHYHILLGTSTSFGVCLFVLQVALNCIGVIVAILSDCCDTALWRVLSENQKCGVAAGQIT